jgi:carbon-monoxide dehydrogenase medium subunit
MIGLGAVADVEGKTLKNVRLAWLAVGDRPTLSPRAMAALEGKTADAATIATAQAALAQDLDPSGDLHADAATRKHLARVLLGRAITALGA